MSEEDITSLPVHHCYVRATVGKERMPAFSMAVRKPEQGDPETAARIRKAAKGYTLSPRDISDGDPESQKRMDRFRKGIAALKEDEVSSEKEEGSAGPQDRERKKQRTKRDRPGEAADTDAAGEERDDGGAGDDAADEERDQ